MRKADVLEFFGGVRETAEAIGVHRSAVYQWPEIVPAESALKCEAASKGKLKASPAFYAKHSQSRTAA